MKNIPILCMVPTILSVYRELFATNVKRDIFSVTIHCNDFSEVRITFVCISPPNKNSRCTGFQVIVFFFRFLQQKCNVSTNTRRKDGRGEKTYRYKILIPSVCASSPLKLYFERTSSISNFSASININNSETLSQRIFTENYKDAERPLRNQRFSFQLYSNQPPTSDQKFLCFIYSTAY